MSTSTIGHQPIAPAHAHGHTAAAASGSGSGAGSGRLRQQSRKKAGQVPQDSESGSIYRVETGQAPHVQSSSTAGAKRTAQDRAEGEPRKRKRVDHRERDAAAFQAHGQNTFAASASAGMNMGSAKQMMLGGMNVGLGRPDGEGPSSLFEFASLPTASLYRYIIQHDLVPAIYPTPLTAEDPPPPTALLDPARMASRAPSPASLLPIPTPANRPRRARDASAAAAARRRSTRLLSEETRGTGGSGPEQVPVLADVGELHGVLAAIAQRHFRESSVREVDTLASFMCAVKAKGARWR